MRRSAYIAPDAILMPSFVNIGAYVPGASLEYDLAVQVRPKIVEFLQQEPNSPVPLEAAKKRLLELATWIDTTEKALKAAAAKPPRPAAAAEIGRK